MSIEFDTQLGLTLTTPDGTVSVEESVAGPGSVQYLLPGGVFISLVRDDQAVSTTAQLIGWTQRMSQFYVERYATQEDISGRIESSGKEAYAYALAFTDAQEVPHYATLLGVLFPTGEFFGVTILTIDLGEPLDTTLIQAIADGLALTSS